VEVRRPARRADRYGDDVGLVERFTEINNSTTSRKTALLCGAVSLPGHLVILIVSYIFIAPLDWIDADRFLLIAWAWVALSLGCALLAHWVGRNGAEGTWTYWVYALPYGALSALALYQFGVQSSPLMAWYPVVIMVVCLWYDAKIGLIALAYGIAIYTPLFILSATDAVPYAPALLDHDLDRQQDPRYVAGIGLLVFLYVTIGTLCAALNSKARALTQQRLDEAHTQLNKSAQLIARYVPAELAEGILAGSESVSEGHHRTKLTVFFSDIVSFSDIAEELEPEDMAMVLNEYFTEMTAIARKHSGMVDELQGDALLIFFGAPQRTDDKAHALQAVAMANEMHAAMESLNQRWRNAGITEEVCVRMAINTGVVTVGNFGSTTRMKYAVLGKHVNIAARLQALCDPGKTLVSYSTYLLVKDRISCTPKGALQLKGIHKPVEAFEVVAPTPSHKHSQYI
jgi:class 3 adenylate cyclase